MEEGTLHKHSCEEEHSIAFSAACRAKVCAALAVSLRSEVCLDILKQLDRSKILRIAADDFEVFVRAIREIDKILDDCQKPFFAEQSAHHSYKGIDAVQFLIVSFNLSPRIEEVIRGEEGTVFVICAIAYYDEGVILEEFRNITAITHGELSIGVHDRCILFDCALKLKHNNRNAIDEYNPVRYA